MMVFDGFSIIIYLILFTAITGVVKVLLDTLAVKKMGQINMMQLQNHFELEKNKSKVISGKIHLVDELHGSIINKLFKITKDILLVQKLIFRKRI